MSASPAAQSTATAQTPAEPSASATASATATQSASAPGTAQPSASAASPPGSHTPAWTYGGATGPSFWGDLDPKFAACKTGKKQSPIDIPSKIETGPKDKDAAKLSVDYLPIALSIHNTGRTVRLQNQANNYVMIGNKRYELIELHFHSPSEHTIAGKRFELEMHLAHKGADGELANVAVLFGPGNTAEQLNEIFKRLPKEVSVEPQAVKGKPLHVAPLISVSDGYYHYEGSLTTPPCSEAVQWFIMKKTFSVAQKDIDRYRELFGGRNNRMVMPIFDRKVLEYKP